MSAEHLHRDDYPNTLALVAAVVAGREDASEFGYRPTDVGAEVDWELLTSFDAPLSSTETGALLIAHACAIAERHGGLPPRLRGVVAAVVDVVS